MELLKEFEWRNLIHTVTPNLHKVDSPIFGFVGFDPTSDSLGIGNLVQVFVLKHFQNTGNHPIALIGGATGMIGDPSGKSEERNLLSAEEINKNIQGQKKQLEHLIPGVKIVNNIDWFQSIKWLDFLRDVGKKFTISSMLNKDSVKSREGISFTEFSYQLMQAFDFFHLWKNESVTLQLGGSDQWGNITAGIDLIGKNGGEVHGLTSPLITKADGSKFGKTEKGNVFLSELKTSIWDFFQFWINLSDEDSVKLIKIFSMLNKNDIDDIVNNHTSNLGKRVCQNFLAEEMTSFVHSKEKSILVKEAAKKLFSNKFDELSINELNIVPSKDVVFSNIFDLVLSSEFLSSKTEIHRAIKEGSLFINNVKINLSVDVNNLLIQNKFLFLKRGKKFLLVKKEN